MSESTHQKAICRWFRMQYPKYFRMFIPSQSGVIVGGKQKFAIIAKQKSEGWLNGAPDIFIAVPRGDYHGLWIELKDEGKTYSSVSKVQREYIEELRAQGYKAEWAAGSDLAIQMITEYMELK